MTIVVGGIFLPDDQLQEFATNAGFQVTSAGVVREKLTGMPWGFGYVNLSEGEDTQRAITWLNSQVLEGNALTVIAAKSQRMDFARAS